MTSSGPSTSTIPHNNPGRKPLYLTPLRSQIKLYHIVQVLLTRHDCIDCPSGANKYFLAIWMACTEYIAKYTTGLARAN